MFSEGVSLYTQDKKSSWTEKTAAENDRMFEIILELQGDK